MRAYCLLSAQNTAERLSKKLEAPAACANGHSGPNSRGGGRTHSVAFRTLGHIERISLWKGF